LLSATDLRQTTGEAELRECADGAEHRDHPLLNHGTVAMLAAISGRWTGRF
jgi:hypothetical protein